MKINKDKLVQLLVEKTGMDNDEVASQLDQLIQRIVDAAQRGKALEIKEFGLFYFSDEGDLKFEPSTEFSTEINFKYAGMEPLEVKPPRDTSMPPAEYGDESDLELEDDPFGEMVAGSGQDDDALSGPEPEEEVEEEKTEETEPVPPVIPEPAEPSSEEDVPDDDPFGIPDEDTVQAEEEPVDEDPFGNFRYDTDQADENQQGEESPADSDKQLTQEEEEEADNSGSYADLLKDASSRLVDEIEDLETEEAAAGQEKENQKDAISAVPAREQKKDPITMIIGIILAFVLLAAGYFVFIEFFRSSPPQASVATATTDMASEPESENESESDTESETSDQSTIPVEAEPEEITEVTEDELQDGNDLSGDEPVYGLTGQVTERGNDGFSIVVFSYNRENQARNIAADLSNEGYRVLVTNRTVQDNPVWRVSLGQFPDVEQALEHAKELPSPYNTENFIQRIQTN